MRYFIRLSYEGTDFHGWQVQQNANSVQAELNRAMEVILRTEKIETTGCGRTDTGVHALKFFVHFDHEEKISSDDLIHQLNSILPNSIAVHSVFPVKPDAHARFSATSRTYIYRIYQEKNPFLRNWSYYLHENPDIDKMNLFAERLKTHTDFSCFAKSNSQTNHNKCLISFADWKREGEEIIFKISADRFLRNMVRAIVGTLIGVGMNKINEKQFDEILDSRDRSAAGVSVPAHGLYLADIKYPFPVH